ncbi:MAG TPA: hypothetical protein ENL34_07205 [Chloroflexi bacterium]|nr:hypothetical protein [Chloroflexota bacterium]
MKRRRYYRTTALLGPRYRVVSHTARRRIRIRWPAVVITVCMIALAGWVGFGNAWYLDWEDATVVGTASQNLAFKIKEASDLMGRHRSGLKPAKAEEAILKKFPQLSSVHVRCAIFPTRCEIEVTERDPILVWAAPEQTYWVDREGIFFPAAGERQDLPVVSGPLPVDVPAEATSGETGYVVEIFQSIATLSSLGISAEALSYDERYGLIWTDPEGCRVAFGVGGDMKVRWDLYRDLVRDLAARGVHPRVIDVRSAQAITYAVEPLW